MYGKLKDGQIIPAPKNFVTSSGNLIFNFDSKPALLIANGYKEIINEEPQYNQSKQEIIFSHYEEQEDTIVAIYNVIDKPLTQEELINSLQSENEELKEQINNICEVLDCVLFELGGDL